MTMSTTIAAEHGVGLLLYRSTNPTAFTEAEKQALGLVGLVPDVTEAEDLAAASRDDATRPQAHRYSIAISISSICSTTTQRSSTGPSCRDPARFLPIVYDPTIGEACLKFGHISPPTTRMYFRWRRGKAKEV